MELGSPSICYANVFIEYAIERNAENVLYDEFSALAYFLRTNRDFRTMLESPIISKDKKLKFICIAVAGNDSPSDVFIRLMNFVLNKKRESYLLSISLMFLDLYRQYKNVVFAKITTAIPISSEVVENMKKLIINKLNSKVMIKQVVDPSIKGGFILDLDNNYRFDASVATQLKKIGKQLMERSKKNA